MLSNNEVDDIFSFDIRGCLRSRYVTRLFNLSLVKIAANHKYFVPITTPEGSLLDFIKHPLS